jgi:tRNA(adenine34) deaminase
LRRRGILAPLVLAACPRSGIAAAPAPATHWMAAAQAMKAQALSWHDQPYGAVLVKGDRIIGFGPSRVVKNRDPDAHAEREAIRHAVAAVGAQAVRGSVLYSTSRPCRACESAAFRAGVARMFFGAEVKDAGEPQDR